MSRSGHEKGDKKGTRLSKTTPSYWASRVRQRSGASDYSVRIKSARRDYWFNLGTSIKDLAARKALEIYLQVKANGADAAVAEYKSPTRSSDVQTVGGYLEAVGSLGLIKAKTFKDYVNGFQTIVSEIKGFPADKSRFDYKGGGNAAWRSKINAVQLSSITPDAVRKWQRARVSAAGNDNTAVKTAKRTANSLMVSARSLFSKKITRRLKVDKTPFDGVEKLTVSTEKYRSSIDAIALIKEASASLKPHSPEAYKTLLLAVCAGLRRAEIDYLEWSMIDRPTGLITLYETEYMSLKTRDSARTIPVEAEILDALGDGAGRFVIESPGKPRNDVSHQYYRCKPVFDEVVNWLRSRGVTVQKPLHELRKEYGSILATNHGIYAASNLLGHSNISTTVSHYADLKERPTAGLGKAITNEL